MTPPQTPEPPEPLEPLDSSGPSETTAPALRPLRQELSILPAGAVDQWLLYDPVRGKYHQIGQAAMIILSHWQAIAPDALLAKLHQKAPELDIDAATLQTLTEFLLKEKLLIHPPNADTETLAGQEAAMRKPFHEQLIHKYLFFRIPLFRPQKFLDNYGPFISAFFRPAAAWSLFAIGVIGLFFAARQWEQFLSTFLYFFTPQGFLFYALSLSLIKALHELGHAFAARHFGARVPVIGIAFLVMFPILYTDTTDVWRIQERRARLWINGAGMVAELSIAAISLCLWSFLPDGVFRSAAFFAATTSWALSLFVNLNPCMRFDGYYLLSDIFRIENLQARGFAAGRWVMRKTLLGLDEGAPEPLSNKQLSGLCLYAWTTWVYRFFLFIGIAILVHHIFPKAIGIVLFTIEIGIFIALPIWREIRHWWSARMKILQHNHGKASLLLSLGLLAVFCLPWQNRISAPALIQPAEQTDIYSASAAQITALHVQNGDAVKAGDILLDMRSPDLDYRREAAIQDLAVAQAQLNRQAASTQDRQLRDIFQDTLSEKRAALTAIERELAQLTLRAPHDGYISDMPDTLHARLYVNSQMRLLQISNPAAIELIGLPKEIAASRVRQGADFTFISDQAGRKPRKGYIHAISPTAAQIITDNVLTAAGGGPIAVAKNKRGEAVADIPVFRVKGLIYSQDKDGIETPHLLRMELLRMERGIVKIAALPSSPAKAVWKNIAKVLLRETDF